LEEMINKHRQTGRHNKYMLWPPLYGRLLIKTYKIITSGRHYSLQI